jgi:CO/xanthine dehydrogenase FAD-binding subunit
LAAKKGGESVISFNFAYYKPASLTEAMQLFHELDAQGKKPLYYGGGTEIITLARQNQIYTQAVIDIKGAPECHILEFRDHHLLIGAAIPLAQLEEASVFPLLSQTCSRIADHTSRVKITIGGNICGKIPYREAILPILLADGELIIAGKNGCRQVPISEIFQQQIKLARGEMLVQMLIPKHYTDCPYVNKKMTKAGRIGYPLLTVSALKYEKQFRFAFSGLCAFPFRSAKLEEEMNRRGVRMEKRMEKALRHLPAPLLSDLHGSSEYRQFVLQNMLLEAVAELGGDEE